MLAVNVRVGMSGKKRFFPDIPTLTLTTLTLTFILDTLTHLLVQAGEQCVQYKGKCYGSPVCVNVRAQDTNRHTYINMRD